jgi:Protein of unknown function (DUF551)
MKWISIKDNKPPTNTRILLFYDYYESVHNHPPEHVRRIRVGKIKSNSDMVIGDHWQYTKLGLTHWMPLPDAPPMEQPILKKTKNDAHHIGKTA